MLIESFASLAADTVLWLESRQGNPLLWDKLLGSVVALAVAAGTTGFLVLVSRLSWAVRQFVDSCRQRDQLQHEIAEILREYLRSQQVMESQMWPAATLPC